MAWREPLFLAPSRAGGPERMRTWIIGDIQGCFETFMALLEQCQFRPDCDRLWLAGDIVNRGPGSLETLAWVYQHREVCTVVLGNHDLHLLMCGEGLRSPKPSDTIRPILEAPNRRLWLDWLRHQPLLHVEDDKLMVHAGLLPAWSLEDALHRAQTVQAALLSDEYLDFLTAMSAQENGLGNEKWALALDTVAVMTRIRMLDSSQEPDFSYKGAPENAPSEYRPWFDSPQQRDDLSRIFFGHWAALGHRVFPGYVALDSGCVWKKKLTAFCLEDSKTCQQAYCE